MKPTRLLAFAIILFAASPAHAWNALGHKVIAKIAWDRIPTATPFSSAE